MTLILPAPPDPEKEARPSPWKGGGEVGSEFGSTWEGGVEVPAPDSDEAAATVDYGRFPQE